ncbi:TolC family protein [Winogradskyella maritima]|nr:TolC family protein [Winogradskyella maritima]
MIQEMNLENTSEIEITKELPQVVADAAVNEITSDSVYNEAREFLPLIKAQELRAKAAKKQVAVSRGRLYPSLSFFAGIGTGYFETTRDTLGNTCLLGSS